MQSQPAAEYSHFLHDSQNDDPNGGSGGGNFNDNDDQADSGSALEDSPRDGHGDDDDEYDPALGEDDEQDGEGSGDAQEYGGPYHLQHADASTGVTNPGLNRHPSSYTITYPATAPGLISQYFYTPPSQNPYSVSGGHGQFYPSVVAQNPVPVPAIAVDANGEALAVQAATSVPAPGPSAAFVTSGLHYPDVCDTLTVLF